MSAPASHWTTSSRRTSPPLGTFQRAARIWLVLGATAVCALAVGLSTGSAEMGMAKALALLLAPDATAASDVLHQLRLPRVLSAFAVGGLLSVAGALMQAILRNPLADPYVLGLSSGAAVGALGAMLLGLGAFLVDMGAIAGAVASLGLLLLLVRVRALRGEDTSEDPTSPRLLLIGVILASGWTAIVTMILVVAPESQLRGMLFWLMGDLAGAANGLPAMAVLVALIVILFPAARDLNVTLLGEDVARTIGVETRGLRRRALVLGSVATAVAVTTAGAIGFVGLVVPHALRLVCGNDQRVLLPASALAGGAFLVVADTIARSAFAPQQVPVGAVTAILGVPAFMWLLLRGVRR